MDQNYMNTAGAGQFSGFKNFSRSSSGVRFVNIEQQTPPQDYMNK
jgi:hypothetical protein